MAQFTFLDASTTFMIFVLILLVSMSFDPSVHAQTFQPRPVMASYSSFIEDQGLYVFRGGRGVNTTSITLEQSFMIVLSLSRSTSDPVYKELPNGPGVENYFRRRIDRNVGRIAVVVAGDAFVGVTPARVQPRNPLRAVEIRKQTLHVRRMNESPGTGAA